jgi:PEP-CTERM motif
VTLDKGTVLGIVVGGEGGPLDFGSATGGGGGGGSFVWETGVVPEPSTWAMMLTGFAGLGWLARARGRKTSPA